MKILMNTGGLAGTNCFVVADEVAKKAVLFDAPDHTVGPLLDEVEKQGWELIGLWLTHAHFDHIADHEVVTKRFPGAEVLLHELDDLKLARPELQTRVFGLPFTIPARQPDAHVTDGQVLQIGAIEIRVIHTPGHAPGHVMYYIPDAQQPILVGGDLIIGGSVGRTDLPDSNHADLEASIRRVMVEVPHNATLLPGHGDPSTLADELATNPYVQQAMRAG